MGNGDIYEYLVRIRQQEAQAFAARESLVTSLRLARQPLPRQLSSTLRQLGTWCLGSPSVPSPHRGAMTPRRLHQ
jgi:hypothetical protein